MSTLDIKIPRLVRSGDSVQLMVEGKPLLLTAGEVHNSSSSSLPYMEGVFERTGALGCNALFVPVSWEMVEPQENQWDFRLVQGLIEQARRHGMRLAPLWFGAYKNASSTYAPQWVKTNPSRFPRQEIEPGRRTGSVSICCEELLPRNAGAFAQLMRFIREFDQTRQTVVMVQVENEVGMLGGSRDHCPLAESAFAGQVPTRLMVYLKEHEAHVRQEVRSPWLAAGQRMAGTWQEVFGTLADEAFMAWHFAWFVGEVAKAGRAEYDLPMFANAWLVQHDGQCPGAYPSGGPVSRMLDIWRAAAPAIELVAPDIYLEDFKGVCADYARGGNPLLIPEARRDEGMAARALYAFGRHHAIAFSPFGIESVGLGSAPAIDGVVADASLSNTASSDAGELLRQTYGLIRNMMPQITQAMSCGRIAGILQTGDLPEVISLGGYQLQIQFNRPLGPAVAPAGGLILSPRDGEFVVAGFGFSVRFLPAEGVDALVDFLEIWEGRYLDGVWTPGRRLNGDEYAVRLAASPAVLQTRVYAIALRSGVSRLECFTD